MFWSICYYVNDHKDVYSQSYKLQKNYSPVQHTSYRGLRASPRGCSVCSESAWEVWSPSLLTTKANKNIRMEPRPPHTDVSSFLNYKLMDFGWTFLRDRPIYRRQCKILICRGSSSEAGCTCAHVHEWRRSSKSCICLVCSTAILKE